MSFSFRTNPADSPLWPIGTLVLWLSCLTVGVLGLRLGYPGLRSSDQPELPPTQFVNVQLTPPPAPLEPPPPPPTPLAFTPSAEPPAPAPPALNPPERPAVVAVAPPSPAIAFALPTEGLTRIVDAGQAGYTRTPMVSTAPAGTGSGTGPPRPAPPPPKPASTSSAPAVSRLVFGEGEGRQPPPEYPAEAARAHEEGTVTLRFTVGEDGRVQNVDITAPSRWPLLNQTAKRAIQDKWRFDPGPKRVYEVPIEFQLNH